MTPLILRAALACGLMVSAEAQALESSVSSSVSIQRPERVVLLALDGLSSRGLKLAASPRLDELAEQGLFIERSQGVMPSKSAPNWTSILTGVWPDDHGIQSNQWWWFRWNRRLTHPTLFTVLKKQKPNAFTSAVYEWKHFGRLWAEEDVDRALWSPNPSKTVRRVKEILENEAPRLLVVHLLQADLAGHKYGWGSAPYLRAISRVDAQVGEVLDKLKKLGLEKNTLVVVASDHGGVGKRHGGDSESELFTPVILRGPGINARQHRTQEIRNVDLTATIMRALNLQTPAGLRGKALEVPWPKSQ